MQSRKNLFRLVCIFLIALAYSLPGHCSVCGCDNDGDKKPDEVFGTTTYSTDNSIYAHYSPNGDTVDLTSTVRAIHSIIIKLSDGSVEEFGNIKGNTWQYVNLYHQIFGIYVRTIDSTSKDSSIAEEYLQNLNSPDNPNWCNCIPLSFSLLNFQAKQMDDDCISISWITATEINTSGFAIEKSRDGRVFNKVGKKEAHGNSHNIISYAFEDSSAIVPGTVFYRITQLHLNGNYEYSNVISLNIHDKDLGLGTCVYPNPTTGAVISVDINAPEEGMGFAQIYNLNGVLLLSKDLNVKIGHNEGSMDLSSLKNGMYLVKAGIGNSFTTIPLYIMGRK